MGQTKSKSSKGLGSGKSATTTDSSSPPSPSPSAGEKRRGSRRSNSKSPRGGSGRKKSSGSSKAGSSHKKGARPSLSSGGESFSQANLETFYSQYQDAEDPNVIGPEGIGRFCADLGVEPEDVLLLVIAYHLGAEEMGYFSKEDFIDGMRKLGVDSMKSLRRKVPELRADIQNEKTFKEIYRFAFLFGKETDQKVMAMEMAIPMIGLVMGDRYKHTEDFLAYLQQQTSYKGINRDQWLNYLEFCKTVQSDYSDYDESSAWPVLLDEFVCWKVGPREDPDDLYAY